MGQKRLFYVLWAALIAALLFAYAKFYDNEFHFDDSHTILNNPYVRDIGNIPLFYTKGPETFSTLPSNQSYRPFVTTTLAIDYWLSTKLYDDGDGYHPQPYHFTMMLSYILLLVLLYLLVIKLFDKAMKTKWNRWAALFVTSWYGLHVVNAETLNYVISRSDLLSTLFVVASFVLFVYFPKQRKWGWFLIPFALGMLTKLTTAMFMPMLAIYFFLFEYPALRAKPMSRSEQRGMHMKLFAQAAILFVIFLGGVAFVMSNIGQNFNPGGPSRWLYLLTQAYVLLHYFISFFYAYNLSADTDMGLVSGMTDWHFIIGFLFVITMLWIAWKSAKDIKYAPISFGILWFFISLAPTSSLIPLAEVANDHRMFFPFVGLSFAVVWAIYLKLWQMRAQVENSAAIRYTLYLLIALLLTAHVYAVRKRVEVWDNGKSLWYDVTQKSPENGRGWMNYGLRLMSEGDYEGAMKAYRKAQQYTPHYPYLYTNIAICLNAQGKPEEAEQNFKNAIKYGKNNHKTYYFYAKFLKQKGRYDEAEQLLKKSLELSPNYTFSSYMLMEIYAEQYRWDELDAVVDRVLARFPKDETALYYRTIARQRLTKLDIKRKEAKEKPTVDNYISLSLEYYNAGHFDSCIWAANQILKLDPNNLAAYNNICAANNQLKNWDAAIAAGEEGLRIDPNDQLLKNNLQVALDAKQKAKDWSKMTAEELLDLSLKLYARADYQGCIDACNASLRKKPRNPVAYNNICSAYNAMHQWDKAVQAGEQAVKYAPDFKLAQNNLAYARQMLDENK